MHAGAGLTDEANPGNQLLAVGKACCGDCGVDAECRSQLVMLAHDVGERRLRVAVALGRGEELDQGIRHAGQRGMTYERTQALVEPRPQNAHNPGPALRGRNAAPSKLEHDPPRLREWCLDLALGLERSMRDQAHRLSRTLW